MGTMTNLDTYLAQVAGRESRATPGPWKNDCGNGQVETLNWRVHVAKRVGNYERQKDVCGMYLGYLEGETIEEVDALLAYDNEHDMDFIAASRADIPKLLRLVAEMRKALEYYRDVYPTHDGEFIYTRRAKEALANADAIAGEE